MIALFFDTETTGFGKARLVQLGAILQDIETGRILSEINTMVHSEDFPIPKDASDIHGITNELADAYGLHMASVDRIFAFMLSKSDVVVAHNIQFDLTIIKHNLELSGNIIGKKRQFCTMQNTIDILKLPGRYPGGNYKWPKMQEAYVHYFGKEFEGAHDAMADVRACRDVYLKLVKGI